jgi:hypothetical protein
MGIMQSMRVRKVIWQAARVRKGRFYRSQVLGIGILQAASVRNGDFAGREC